MRLGWTGTRVSKRKCWDPLTRGKMKRNGPGIWKKPPAGPPCLRQIPCASPHSSQSSSWLFPDPHWTLSLPFLPTHFLSPRTTPLLPSPHARIQMPCNLLGSIHLLLSPLSLFWSLQPPDSWSACSLSSFASHFWCGNCSCYSRTIMCILQCSVAIWRKKVVISSGQKKEAGVELSYFLPIWF